MSFMWRIFTRPRLTSSSRELIGPPDPVSNIRPVSFQGHSSPSSITTHPYSLAEFSEADEDSIDLQWRLERERLITFNHTFWRDSNTRFMRGKQEVLDKIQERGILAAKDKEAALSAFYSQWTIQEATRQAEYTAEWNERNYVVIKLTIRRQIRIWKNSFLNAILGNSC